MTVTLTLAERRRRTLEAMARALHTLDAALLEHARREGGRFIRYGSSATGALHPRSDVDVIADFADERTAHAACRLVDDLCLDLGLVADVRPGAWVSEALLARALSEGVVLR